MPVVSGPGGLRGGLAGRDLGQSRRQYLRKTSLGLKALPEGGVEDDRRDPWTKNEHGPFGGRKTLTGFVASKHLASIETLKIDGRGASFLS